MASIAVTVTRGTGNDVSWEVEARGSQGWLWVILNIEDKGLINEGQQGYTFGRSGTVELRYTTPRITFLGAVGDNTTPGNHGAGIIVRGHLDSNQTSATFENSG